MKRRTYTLLMFVQPHLSIHILLTLPFQFDPQCFSFVLSFFRQAQDTFYGTSSFPGLFQAQQHLDQHLPSEFSANQNPLLTKQAIIVLREELEYFAIPPQGDPAKTSADPVTGQPSEILIDLKRECGTKLLEKKSIFTALQRNVSKENNLAEQHLIDMLCMRCVPYSLCARP